MFYWVFFQILYSTDQNQNNIMIKMPFFKDCFLHILHRTLRSWNFLRSNNKINLSKSQIRLPYQVTLMSMATNKKTSNNGWLVVYCLAPARINFYNRDLKHTRRTLYYRATVVELCMARYGMRLFYYTTNNRLRDPR